MKTAAIKTDCAQRWQLIVSVPSVGARTDVSTPYEAYCAIMDYLDSGYMFNEMEFEKMEEDDGR